MSLIRLSNIGKIYVSEGNVGVGIRGINLSFEAGEFVAVTGQSGSGKTTLLNVISGMDTYEEGELYIREEPTSHYRQPDWEVYREQNISFIFQDYNILDSFTVLENVELALLHIPDRHERRRRAVDLIRRVGLGEHMHHKGSRLSGGQKQRTVIARALAKDSPIILADEPTGNLDSATSKEVLALLREVSKDKLVILVTHNFEDVEPYATRHIRIFDGAVEFDRPLAHVPDIPQTPPAPVSHPLSQKRSALTLGCALFKAKPKFSVFLCLLMLLPALGFYAISLLFNQSFAQLGTQELFTHIPGRAIISTLDGSTFTEEELEQMARKLGAVSSLYNDSILDISYRYDHYDYEAGIDASFRFVLSLTAPRSVDIGRLPEGPGEVCLRVPISLQKEFGKEAIASADLFERYAELPGTRLVGVDYYYDNTVTPSVYVSPDVYSTLTVSRMLRDMNISLLWQNESGSYISYSTNMVLFTPELSGRDVVLYDKWSGELDFQDGMDCRLELMSYSGSVQETLYGFTIRPAEQYPALSGPDYYSSCLFLSTDVLDELKQILFAGGRTQASLFFETDDAAAAVLAGLREDGYIGLLSDTEQNNIEQILLGVISIVGSALLTVVAVLFLTFFLSLCTARSVSSMKDDLAILRSMGIRAVILKAALYFRMLLTLIPAYLCVAAAACVIYLTPALNGKFIFIHAHDYLIIALGMLLLILLVTRRHINRIFRQSVRKTLKGGNEA